MREAPQDYARRLVKRTKARAWRIAFWLAPWVCLTCGCAASFEGPGGQVALGPPPSPRCIMLDNQAGQATMITEGAGFAAGASGLAMIPTGPEARPFLIGTAVGAGIVAAGAGAWAHNRAATWARECQ